MAVHQTLINGVQVSLEKLSDGAIRVSHPSTQVNPMHGPETLGVICYHVHPCQSHQYEFFNAQLPPSERAMPADVKPDQRPWWSLSAGERAGLRD